MTVATSEHVFPTRVLDGADTALVLYAAAFGGAQDARFVRDAGLRATCVDTNVSALRRMARRYPDDWSFVDRDAYRFARQCEDDAFDVVSVDPFTGAEMDRCAERVAEWCRVARIAVVLGVARDTRVRPPERWRVSETMARGGRLQTYWLILEPK